MDLLQPMGNEQAYLKCGLTGFSGAGKTFSATALAIGLHQFIKSERPVAFFDTETGSSYVADNFKQCGIPLIGCKKRSFVDLLSFTKAAENQCDIAVIDSVTHPYDELIKGYMDKLDRTRLRVQDWGPIKEEWKQFSDLYLNSRLHIILCGRAGWVYEFKEDEDGVTDIQKTGTRMKTETDFGYEPGLSIEMERIREGSGRIGQTIHPRAWVIKDRFNVIQGSHFDFPIEKDLKKAVDRTFNAVLPHIERLNLKGEYKGVDTESKSKDLFESPQSRSNWIKRKEIALENLKIELDKRWSSRSDAGAKKRVEVLERVFNTASATAIADLSPEILDKGLIQIKEMENINA